MPAGHDLLFVEVPVDNLDIVLNSDIPLRPRRIVGKHGYVAGQAILEEAFLRDMIDDVEIVVEINEMLAEPRYFVKVSLDDN